MVARASLKKAIAAVKDAQPSDSVSAGRHAAASFVDAAASTTRLTPATVHAELAHAVAAATATLRAAALGSASRPRTGVHHAAPAVALGTHAGKSAAPWTTFTADLTRHLSHQPSAAGSTVKAPRRPHRASLSKQAQKAPPPQAATGSGAWPVALLASLPHGLLNHFAARPHLTGKLPRLRASTTTAPLYGLAAGLADLALSLAWQAVCVRALFSGSGQHFRGIVALNEEPRRRPKTMSRREMLRERRRRERAGELLEIAAYARPQTRADCIDGARPCLFVACKHHLYLDVNPETGSIKINFPDRDVWELDETCALDVAERGGVTLEEVGDILNLTRERVRQVEVTGLTKLKGESPQHELDVFVGWDSHPDDM
jgi:hypothetical protein